MKQEMPKWCFGLAGPVGVVRRAVRRHVRPSHGRLRVRERRTDVRALPHRGGLLRQLVRHHHGHQGHVLPGRLPHQRRKRVALPGGRTTTRTRPRFRPCSIPSAPARRSTAATTCATARWSAYWGQIACYTGKATNWDDVLKSDLQFGPAPEESSFATEPPSVPDATGNYPAANAGDYAVRIGRYDWATD